MISPRHWRCVVLATLLLATTIPMRANADDTLYQRLGGQAGITRIVEEAHALFLADDRVKDDFDNINAKRLNTRLVEQICVLARGPCVYHGRSMAAAHNGLNVTQAKFNAVAEDLQTAMEHRGIPYWTQNQLMALLAPMQRDIVTR
ncbi:group I truncated hemoglobin [Rhodopila sp.]|uniref:group I truncated hemoglobin n=1 Tax=Rhodopila sp. TaxID=2480087 RepID=UPI003D0D2618